MSMQGIPVSSEIEAHRQTGVHVSNQPFSKGAGNHTQETNHAVAHGLGRPPTQVWGSLWNGTDVCGTFAYNSDGTKLFIVSGNASGTSAGGTIQTVTGWDATNFYITIPATQTFYWAAI